MSGGRPSKLKRIIEQYGFETLGDELEAYWTDGTESRRSLRDLAEHVNHRLLNAEMTRAGLDPLEGEVANLYRLLTDDDVTEGSRTRARRQLEEAGIDVAQLRDRFVSRQAVHTYLTKHRDANPPTNEVPPDTAAAEQIRRLRGRTRRVTETKLRQLRDSGQLAVGSTRVLVDVNVICEECGVQYSAVELIEGGKCTCEHKEDS
jgi:hypothetical protein